MIGMKLETGQVFKNYKSICEFLEVKPASGNTKKSHMKEFNRYCEYHKDGNKFIVDKVYGEPQEKFDGRVNNRGHAKTNTKSILYDDLMEQIIMYYLNENGQIVDSYYSIVFDMFELVTDKYNNTTMNGYQALADELGCKTGIIRTYVLKSQNILRDHFKSALTRLQKQGYITFKESYNVYRQNNYEVETLSKDSEIAELICTEKWAYSEMIVKKSDGSQRESSSYDRIDTVFNKKFKRFVCKNLDKLDIFNYCKVYIIDKDISFRKFENRDNIQDVKNDLINRYIAQIHNKLINHKMVDNKGSIYYPYASRANVNIASKLDKIFWNTNNNVVTAKNEIQGTISRYDMESDCVLPF